jgi:hypothetical protein
VQAHGEREELKRDDKRALVCFSFGLYMISSSIQSENVDPVSRYRIDN